MSVYFVLKLRIFVMMGSTNEACYFVLEIFMMMGSTNVWFLCLMLFTLLYFIIR